MSKSKVTEILQSYNRGVSMEEINKQLEAIGSSIRLDPNANTVTPEMEKEGWGYLDCGIGLPDKCKVDLKKMELEFDDMGDMYATFEFPYSGKRYVVKGKKLEEI